MFVSSKQFKTLMQNVDDLIDVVDQLRHENEDLKQRVSLLEGLRNRKVSDEPWVEVLGGDLDPEKGIEMKLDWNDAFINQLRSQGYTGSSESSLVGKWLLNVSKSVGDDL